MLLYVLRECADQKFQRASLVVLGALLCGSCVLLYNWDSVKQKVGEEGADVIRVGITNENLHVSAAEFSKALINQILEDEQVLSIA